MNFKFKDTQTLIQEMVREFAESEIKPYAQKRDKEEKFPFDIIPKLAELGLMGIVVPERWGGGGADYVSMVLAIEEIARHDGSLGLTIAAHNCLCVCHINLAGTDKQKETYLIPLASGKKIGAWGLTEPGSGSDASALKTTAVKQNGSWIINGTKMFITHGSVGDIYVILALTSPQKKQKGITAFIIEKDTPGMQQGKKLSKLGMRSSDTTELILEEVKIPDSQRLGEIDKGFIDTLKVLDRGRISIAALALGIGRGALEQAKSYAKERIQFGKPIAEFQAIQWMIADAATKLEAARLLTLKAAWLQDQQKPVTTSSAMAKLFAAQAAMQACNIAIQIHGGYGYTTEYPVERFFRDAKLCEIGEGTNEIQKLIIARDILGKI
jgi:alkylation response protein AidB-like acyl-CoA dehydrogenase